MSGVEPIFVLTLLQTSDNEYPFTEIYMVLILDGNTEIGAHVRTNLFKAFDLIKSSHKSDIFSPKRHIFLYACAICSELPSNISFTEI